MGKKKKRDLATRIADAHSVAECLEALGDTMAAGAALRKGDRKTAKVHLVAALKLIEG